MISMRPRPKRRPRPAPELPAPELPAPELPAPTLVADAGLVARAPAPQPQPPVEAPPAPPPVEAPRVPSWAHGLTPTDLDEMARRLAFAITAHARSGRVRKLAAARLNLLRLRYVRHLVARQEALCDHD